MTTSTMLESNTAIETHSDSTLLLTGHVLTNSPLIVKIDGVEYKANIGAQVIIDLDIDDYLLCVVDKNNQCFVVDVLQKAKNTQKTMTITAHSINIQSETTHIKADTSLTILTPVFDVCAHSLQYILKHYSIICDLLSTSAKSWFAKFQTSTTRTQEYNLHVDNSATIKSHNTHIKAKQSVQVDANLVNFP